MAGAITLFYHLFVIILPKLLNTMESAYLYIRVSTDEQNEKVIHCLSKV